MAFYTLKGVGDYVMPVGTDSRNSLLTVDDLLVDDSVIVYYWDWYGTEGLSKKKSALAANKITILENLRMTKTGIRF